MSKVINECSVCCAEVKSAISCLACKYVSCVPCAQQFLLSTHNARCMSCGHAWDELFIRNTFSTNWVEKQYKAHRKASLIDLEKSYLAESMPYVVQYKQIVAYESEAKELEEKYSEEMKELEYKLSKLTMDLKDVNIHKKRSQEATTKRLEIKEEIVLIDHQIRDKKEPISSLKWRAETTKATLKENINGIGSAKQTKVVYNTPCIDKNCRGFLSSDWKCGLCSKQVCKHCREDITNKKDTHTGEQVLSHKCDPNTVATIKAMFTDAVPCPKCKEPISRVSGCSHMFCTWCNTGFDYKTGQIIDAKHNTNPHFYRWQAQQQQAPTQAPQVNVCATPQQLAYTIENKLKQIYNCYDTPQKNTYFYREAVRIFCYNITSLIGECQTTQVEPYGPQHNRMSRIKYLAGEQSEKELARDSMKEYKRVMYDVELTQLKAMLRETLIDWLRNFAYFVDTQCTHQTNLFKESIFMVPKSLVDYYNCEARKLAKAFDYSCYQEAKVRMYVSRRRKDSKADPYMDVVMCNDDITKINTNQILSSEFKEDLHKPVGWSITSQKI